RLFGRSAELGRRVENAWPRCVRGQQSAQFREKVRLIRASLLAERLPSIGRDLERLIEQRIESLPSRLVHLWTPPHEAGSLAEPPKRQGSTRGQVLLFAKRRVGPRRAQ